MREISSGLWKISSNAVLRTHGASCFSWAHNQEVQCKCGGTCVFMLGPQRWQNRDQKRTHRQKSRWLVPWCISHIYSYDILKSQSLKKLPSYLEERLWLPEDEAHIRRSPDFKCPPKACQRFVLSSTLCGLEQQCTQCNKVEKRKRKRVGEDRRERSRAMKVE